jgi:WD40 repeat protein
MRHASTVACSYYIGLSCLVSHFVVCIVYTLVACITLLLIQDGTLDIWDIDAHVEEELISEKIKTLHHPDCITPIRMTAFSPDNTTLLACCDDASIWRWDLTL